VELLPHPEETDKTAEMADRDGVSAGVETAAQVAPAGGEHAAATAELAATAESSLSGA
jgi:hypothetical protein